MAFSAAFEGRPDELFVRPSRGPGAQELGLHDVHLLAASATGELAVIVHPRFPFGWAPEGTLARVPSVGGIPRELAEDAEFADWSPRGDLAVVVRRGLNRVLEFPPGHELYRTGGRISGPRFSPKGDRIAFLHHPTWEDSAGEVMVTDLQGHTRTLSKRWPEIWGLAWSPDGSEVWFTGGTDRANTLAAVDLAGRTREVYRSFSDLVLEDVGPDGRVLITNVLRRNELAASGDGAGAVALLSWTDWNDPLASISAEGKVLFSVAQTVQGAEGSSTLVAVLRATDGSPAQVLGQGVALDLSSDGRWALVCSFDGKTVTALPTGAGRPRSIPMHGMEITLRAARWMADGKAVLAIARAPGQSQALLYRLSEDGSAPTRVSDAALHRAGYLQLSPDGRWAAAIDEQLRLVVISLQDGATHRVPQVGTDPVPRGWSPDGKLWITQPGPTKRAGTRLLRIDPRTGNRLEERSIGPSDPAGIGPLQDVVLSPDGRRVAFTYPRRLGTLYVASGLVH